MNRWVLANLCAFALNAVVHMSKPDLLHIAAMFLSGIAATICWSDR